MTKKINCIFSILFSVLEIHCSSVQKSRIIPSLQFCADGQLISFTVL